MANNIKTIIQKFATLIHIFLRDSLKLRATVRHRSDKIPFLMNKKIEMNSKTF